MTGREPRIETKVGEVTIELIHVRDKTRPLEGEKELREITDSAIKEYRGKNFCAYKKGIERIAFDAYLSTVNLNERLDELKRRINAFNQPAVHKIVGKYNRETLNVVINKLVEAAHYTENPDAVKFIAELADKYEGVSLKTVMNSIDRIVGYTENGRFYYEYDTNRIAASAKKTHEIIKELSTKYKGHAFKAIVKGLESCSEKRYPAIDFILETNRFLHHPTVLAMNLGYRGKALGFVMKQIIENSMRKYGGDYVVEALGFKDTQKLVRRLDDKTSEPLIKCLCEIATTTKDPSLTKVITDAAERLDKKEIEIISKFIINIGRYWANSSSLKKILEVISKNKGNILFEALEKIEKTAISTADLLDCGVSVANDLEIIKTAEEYLK